MKLIKLTGHLFTSPEKFVLFLTCTDMLEKNYDQVAEVAEYMTAG